MQNLLNYLQNKGFNIEESSTGGFNNKQEYKVDYDMDIGDLEDNLRKSLAFYPYVRFSKNKATEQDMLELFNNLNEFYSTKPYSNTQINLVIATYGHKVLMPHSADAFSILENEEEKHNMYKLYLQEFDELSTFLINKK